MSAVAEKNRTYHRLFRQTFDQMHLPYCEVITCENKRRKGKFANEIVKLRAVKYQGFTVAYDHDWQ